MTTEGTTEGEGAAQVEAFTAIADLKPESTVSVMAVCTSDPWSAGRNLWKTRLADTSGDINMTMRGTSKFNFKAKDVVAGYKLQVRQYKGDSQLVVVSNSNITVNPDPNEETEKLREWYKGRVVELMNQRAKQGFSPIASLEQQATVHVLAVCTREPWQVGKTMWKTLLRDASGQVVAMKRNNEFGFKFQDVVAAYSLTVGEFRGGPELEVRYNTDVVVNPDLAEAAQLREWYQNQVSQVENKTITQIADLKKNTTANILAVCTSDPMERPMLGAKRLVWQATLRDTSAYINAMKDDVIFNFGLNDVVEARGVFVREFILGTEIVMDNNTVITVNPDTEEAAKLREWYQTQGKRECVKTDETEQMAVKIATVVQDHLRSNAQMKCALCNVWCSGLTAYKNHVSGKPHRNAMLKRGTPDGNGTADGGPPTKKSRAGEDPNEIRCEVCDIFMSGQVTYDAHMKGARHMKKLQELDVAKFVSTLPHIEENPERKEYRCTVCQVPLSSKIVIVNHIKGAKHTKKAKGLAETVNTAAQPTETVNTAAQPPEAANTAAQPPSQTPAPEGIEMKQE